MNQELESRKTANLEEQEHRVAGDRVAGDKVVGATSTEHGLTHYNSPSYNESSGGLAQSLGPLNQTLQGTIVQGDFRGATIYVTPPNNSGVSFVGQAYPEPTRALLTQLVEQTQLSELQLIEQAIALLAVAVKAEKEKLHLVIIDNNNNFVSEVSRGNSENAS